MRCFQFKAKVLTNRLVRTGDVQHGPENPPDNKRGEAKEIACTIPAEC